MHDVYPCFCHALCTTFPGAKGATEPSEGLLSLHKLDSHQQYYRSHCKARYGKEALFIITMTVHYLQAGGRDSHLKLFRAYSGYIHHDTFSFMMSLPAMSLGLRFCVSRKGGTGEVGGCTRRVQTAWPRLGSSLEATWLALGGPFLSSLA